MTTTSTPRGRMAALALACGLAGACLGGGAAFAYQNHMVNALNDLQRALNQLQIATPDKGGHRDNAIALIDQAIGQVNAGIAYAR